MTAEGVIFNVVVFDPDDRDLSHLLFLLFFGLGLYDIFGGQEQDGSFGEEKQVRILALEQLNPKHNC